MINTSRPVAMFDSRAHTIKCGLPTLAKEPKTLLGKKWLNIDPREHSFPVAEANFNMYYIQETYDLMVFEEWEFASYYWCPSAA
ncbi:hypothetical protein FRC08_003221 [Ceratobasidium sp. 394]|nr:hypothetical protein FRC08_003221 [Ceratobasidium sp. 394]